MLLGHAKGEEKALTFQIAGGSNSGLSPDGEWRCLVLADVTDARLQDGEWRVGSRQSGRQSCVEEVDLDINPQSPYNPKRRL